jgi:hypothetical protein
MLNTDTNLLVPLTSFSLANIAKYKLPLPHQRWCAPLQAPYMDIKVTQFFRVIFTIELPSILAKFADSSSKE